MRNLTRLVIVPYTLKSLACFVTFIVNGGYGKWSNFTSCTKSCGGGVQYRNRSCNKPVPMYGGNNCSLLGNASESRACNTDPCPGTYIHKFILSSLS